MGSDSLTTLRSSYWVPDCPSFMIPAPFLYHWTSLWGACLCSFIPSLLSFLLVTSQSIFWQWGTTFLELHLWFLLLDHITVSKWMFSGATSEHLITVGTPGTLHLSAIHQQTWSLWQLEWPWWRTPPTCHWGRGRLWRQTVTLLWALPAFPAATSCRPTSSMLVSVYFFYLKVTCTWWWSACFSDEQWQCARNLPVSVNVGGFSLWWVVSAGGQNCLTSCILLLFWSFDWLYVNSWGWWKNSLSE